MFLDADIDLVSYCLRFIGMDLKSMKGAAHAFDFRTLWLAPPPTREPSMEALDTPRSSRGNSKWLKKRQKFMVRKVSCSEGTLQGVEVC